ncbi:hypothetical protein Y1Q_0017486 [Alligator mississippiensis]|uniref:Uncharacterized protein n=1 Tax=Alligator mississippiensis TaxID=8496 RepID=A0A151P344_ALLMI|nr:hypothetical protein Y1Q_0017486 [Alligator mississippiensis]
MLRGAAILPGQGPRFKDAACHLVKNGLQEEEQNIQEERIVRRNEKCGKITAAGNEGFQLSCTCTVL